MLLLSALRKLTDLSARVIGPKYIAVETTDVSVDQAVIRIYKPKNSKSDQVIIYCHGGGWVIGSIEAYDRILRYISSRSNILTVSVGYRRAPEFKHPAALEDLYSVYCWVKSNITSNIVLAGDSAGGNLIFLLLQKLISSNITLPDSMVMIYPAVGVNKDIFKSSVAKRKSLFNRVGDKILLYCLGSYLPDIKQAISNERDFYKEIEAYKGTLPKILLLKAEHDPLLPYINHWLRKMLKAGADISVISYENTIHGFINFAGIYSRAQKALDDIVKYVSNKDNLKF